MNRLVRTEKALAEYDALDAEFDAQVDAGNLGNLFGMISRLERLAMLVGEAYGRDTSNTNDVDTCRGCVRPSLWLRRMVELGRQP